jgi:hypothetical protein
VATKKQLQNCPQDYDNRVRHRENSFSTLSPMKGGLMLPSDNNASDPRLPRFPDVYLCDICGKDFESLKKVLVRNERGTNPVSVHLCNDSAHFL